ncbi:hypothetical protein LguiA_002635 [Lonicera macranthoides]
MATINGGKVECRVRGGDGSGPAGDEWWLVVERDWWEERRENVDEERERISCLAIEKQLEQIIYKSAMELAGVEEASIRIAVGDSLHHDIKGANVAGIQSAFITGGIHANELGLSKFGQVLADPSSLHELTSKFDAYPSYVLPSFTCHKASPTTSIAAGLSWWSSSGAVTGGGSRCRFSLQEIASKNDSIAEKLSQP